MRIALVTDAWLPQVNGVVRTLTAITGEVIRRGHAVEVIAPDQFRNVARALSARGSRISPRTRCTSPPRDRSAGQRGPIA